MRYRGTPYPILKTSTGYFSPGDDIAQIKANMLVLILTRPGERIMELDFGTPLDKLDLSKPTELLVEDARQMIASVVKRWERRIQVTNVGVVFIPRYDLKPGLDINIQVSFINPINLQQEHVLTLQTPLDGGNYVG